MKIQFRRIGTAPQPFDLRSGDVTFSGTLELKKRTLTLLKAHIGGSIKLPCDICAETVERQLDEEVEFLLSDGISSVEDEEYDIVEVEDSVIDLDEILHSEIELIKSDYFSCESCKTNERNQSWQYLREE